MPTPTMPSETADRAELIAYCAANSIEHKPQANTRTLRARIREKMPHPREDAPTPHPSTVDPDNDRATATEIIEHRQDAPAPATAPQTAPPAAGESNPFNATSTISFDPGPRSEADEAARVERLAAAEAATRIPQAGETLLAGETLATVKALVDVKKERGLGESVKEARSSNPAVKEALSKLGVRSIARANRLIEFTRSAEEKQAPKHSLGQIRADLDWFTHWIPFEIRIIEGHLLTLGK